MALVGSAIVKPAPPSAVDMRPAEPGTPLALATTTVAPSVTIGGTVVVGTSVVVARPRSTVVVVTSRRRVFGGARPVVVVGDVAQDQEPGDDRDHREHDAQRRADR